MFLENILIVIICSVLRKRLQTKLNLPQWDKVLIAGIFSAVGLIIADIFIKGDSEVVRWISHLIIFYLLYIVFKTSEFRYSLPFIYSLLPIIVLSFIQHLIEIISAALYHKWANYFDAALTLGYVWSVAMWFITKRQRKALEKERLKNVEISKKNKLNEELKVLLEVQVAERTALLTLQKTELEHTLNELKSTQSLLIQSEKMASLGELTAGIAHEIQNPLNFVNNFSEVNKELLVEMKIEIDKGNMNEVKTIAADIISNEEKINHHGKRADAIVKGMLQHSRSSSGVKEPTDINALADEYLRLSYHGLRAKDKTFNAKFETDFDETIGKINIIPQDIGRVVLNLLNNAFYAVNEKNKLNIAGYVPTIFVTTRILSNKVEIRVSDNGIGIPIKVLDKIFQPFFTTKPTGEGTGLGLSLSYDIVTKGHGGELKVEIKENEETSFSILLPI